MADFYQLTIHTRELTQRRLAEAQRERLARLARGQRRASRPALAAALAAVSALLNESSESVPAARGATR